MFVFHYLTFRLNNRFLPFLVYSDTNAPLEIIRWLLESDPKKESILRPDKWGDLPLHTAWYVTEEEDEELIAFILKREQIESLTLLHNSLLKLWCNHTIGNSIDRSKTINCICLASALEKIITPWSNYFWRMIRRDKLSFFLTNPWRSLCIQRVATRPLPLLWNCCCNTSL